MDEALLIAFRPGKARGGEAEHRGAAALAGELSDRAYALLAQIGVADDAAAAHAIATDLKLWFHHHNSIEVIGCAVNQCRQNLRQLDEREIGREQIRPIRELVGVELTGVGALEDMNPWILTQRPSQFAVTNVDRDHLSGAALK